MWIIAIIAAAVLVGIDQLTKYLALVNLKPIGSTTVVDGFLDLTFVENRGVAFGMFSGKKWFILLLTLCIVAFLVYYFVKMPRTKEYQWVRCAMVLVLAGAVGNMLDRVFRGYVVDFFYFSLIDFPIFNVADIYVTMTFIVLVLLIFFYYKDEDFSIYSRRQEQKHAD